MAELNVQTSTLRTAAGGLGSAADLLDQQWQNLLSTVSGLGAPWGGDDIGMLIGESYTAIQDVAAESYGSAIEDLRAFAEGLITMADNYDTGEQESTSAITSVTV